MPLCTSRTVTVAPAIAPPLWSVTDPRMRPALPCENSGRHIRNTPTVAANTRRQTPVFIRKNFICPLYDQNLLELTLFQLRCQPWLQVWDAPPTCESGMRISPRNSKRQV